MPPGGHRLHLMLSTVIILHDMYCSTVVTQLYTAKDKTFSILMPPPGRLLHLMLSTVIVLLDI